MNVGHTCEGGTRRWGAESSPSESEETETKSWRDLEDEGGVGQEERGTERAFLRRRFLSRVVEEDRSTRPRLDADSKAFWIILYFAFNLVLTLSNKTVLLRFPFPYTLTAIHSLFGFLGSIYMAHLGAFYLPNLSMQDKVTLLLFSFLYSINIITSNASLSLVSIPFHQVVRSSAPIFTVSIAYLISGSTTANSKLLSLVPVILGVAFTTYGEYDYALPGLLLTFLGTFLAALKTVCTNILQRPPIPMPTPLQSYEDPSSKITRLWPFQRSRVHRLPLSLHPLALLGFLSPLSFVQCVILAYTSGELELVSNFARTTPSILFSLAINGMIAFGLNVVSFSANRQVGALGITVAANVKQVLTVLCAVSVYHLEISPLNGLGIVLTLWGGGWYAFLEYSENSCVPAR
ncbi:triose-phosphate transporter family-domain-containing protein [Flagelloscypha sp. PMI_526]|nr:triose-phosphate transporter family-domain-containing protein [Flagelloscypha sp. PMI_526]